MRYNPVFVFQEIELVLVNHYIYFQSDCINIFGRGNFFCFVLSKAMYVYNVCIVCRGKQKIGKEKRSRRGEDRTR